MAYYWNYVFIQDFGDRGILREVLVQEPYRTCGATWREFSPSAEC